MWNRYNYPTVNDADEGGDILILRNNGRKSIYNWEDFCDEKSLGLGPIAWMPLPQSDIPQPITITISSGGRFFTIEMVGSNIEVHDSHDPMGHPIICGNVDDIDGVLLVVESILADHIMGAPDDDDDCGCEGVDVNDTVLQGFIDAIRGKEPTLKTWQKKSPPPPPPPPPPSSGTILIKEGENLVPEPKPRPWQKNRGK